jgi:hypothetical protein
MRRFDGHSGQIGSLGTRELMRIVYRDPEHVSERLTLYASQRLAAPSRDWAQCVRRKRSDTPPATIAEELRTHSAQLARIDGAVRERSG